MTNLTKPVRRVTPATVFEVGKLRDIVVIVYPKAVGFRAMGCKREYQLPTEHLYLEAVEAHVRADKKKKKKEREQKRKAKKLNP